MSKWFVCLLIFFCLGMKPGIAAQEDSPVTLPETIVIEAADGTQLYASYYAQPADAAPEGGYPAVLLLHPINMDRTAWQRVIEPLFAEGFVLLAVDRRGNGETTGSSDSLADVDDVAVWLAWLKSQPGIGKTAVGGASLGANIALAGCAENSDCVTAIVISPIVSADTPERLDILTGLTAMSRGLRPMLFLVTYGEAGGAISEDVRLAISQVNGIMTLRVYRGDAHATDLFRTTSGESAIHLIVDWLHEYLDA